MRLLISALLVWFGLGVPAVHACVVVLAASPGQNAGLSPGDCMWSPSGDYTLIMQPDGSLALYDLHNPGTAIWHAMSEGAAPGVSAWIQEDGNFVIYNGAQAIWWSGATLPPGLSDGYRGNFFLMVQDDGSVAVFSGTGPDDPNRALTWSSRTIPDGYSPSRTVPALAPTTDSRVNLGWGDLPTPCSRWEWRNVYNATLSTSRQRWFAYASVSMPQASSFEPIIKECAVASAATATLAKIYASPNAVKPTFLATMRECMRLRSIGVAAQADVSLSIETQCIDW